MRGEDITDVVKAQPHRRGLPVIRDKNGRIKTDFRMDQKAENLLGLLSLHKVITDDEYEAGKKYSETVARYRVVLAAPNPLMSPTPGNGGDITPWQKKHWTDAYEAAESTLSKTGHEPFTATRLVAIYGIPIVQFQVPHLRCGLRALAMLWGLTSGRQISELGK